MGKVTCVRTKNKAVCGDVTLKLKKDLEWEEYQVLYYNDGELNEDKSYYGSSIHDEGARDDALETMNDMIDFIENEQKRR